MSDDNSLRKTKYTFKSIDGSIYTHSVDINEKTLLHKFEPEHKPEWTLLENNQCSNCPYSTDDFKYCPVALGLAQLLENFSGSLSYTECLVIVETPERNYNKQTEVQNGIYSIMGLIMATSACSKVNTLKSMARFHLPFSTLEETLIRSLGFYLVGQYLHSKKTGQNTFDLSKLHEIYDDLNKVNEGILKRVRSISKKDANKNAIVVLDAFASMLSFAIKEDFSEIEQWFGQD